MRKDIETLCQRIASEISRPFIVNGNEVYISVSMGIALAPQDAMNASDLIRLSDIALYKAKNTGRNNWVFYEPNMGEYLIQRREMEKKAEQTAREMAGKRYAQTSFSWFISPVTTLKPRVSLLSKHWFAGSIRVSVY